MTVTTLLGRSRSDSLVLIRGKPNDPSAVLGLEGALPMAFWPVSSTRKGRNWLRHLCDKGNVLIISPDVPFDPEYQIEPDAINLRLHPYAMRLKPGITLDPLDGLAKISQYFDAVSIPKTGLALEPGGALFCRVLETILIKSDKYLGLVLGRRNVAGFGISIHCDQPKFPSGLPWNFPLQLQNRTTNAILIYPFMYVAQLVLVEYPYPAHRAYEGQQRFNVENYVPFISEEEQRRISEACDRTRDAKPEGINTRVQVEDAFNKFEKSRRRRTQRIRALVSRAGLAPAFGTLAAVLASVTASLVILSFYSPPGPSAKLIGTLVALTLVSFVLERLSR